MTLKERQDRLMRIDTLLRTLYMHSCENSLAGYEYRELMRERTVLTRWDEMKPEERARYEHRS